jgi:hypothetical protein
MGRALAFILLSLCFLSVLPSAGSARLNRSPEVTREFQRQNPCPSTGKTSGRCPGYVKDHVIPLACGGADKVANLQWQTTQEGKAKDRTELSCQVRLPREQSVGSVTILRGH